MHKKNINVFVFPIIALFTFLMLIFGATYAYLSGVVSMNTTNYQVVLPKATSLICTKTDCGLTITPGQMTQTNNSTTAKSSSNCFLNCTCSGTQGAFCNYNVTLMPEGTPYYPTSGLGTNKEFTVKVTSPSGCATKNSSSTETQVNTLSSMIVSNCSLEIPAGGTKTANVQAEFKWYNLGMVQDTHIGKSFVFHLTNNYDLPSEYQRVDYIESTGSQYIDTGVNAVGKIRADAKFAFTNTPSSYYVLAGARDGSANRGYIFGTNDSGNWANGYISTLSGFATKPVANTIYVGSHTLSNGSQTLYVNDLSYKASVSGSLNINYSIYLFALHYNGSSTVYSKARIYYFNLYVNDTLVRAFVPCYLKNGGTIGMYDMVYGEFYTTPSGTFTKGSDI